MNDDLLSIAAECGAQSIVMSIETEDAPAVEGALFPSESALSTFAERIRQQERERAAKVCDEIERLQENDHGAANTGGAAQCAAELRKGGGQA